MISAYQLLNGELYLVTYTDQESSGEEFESVDDLPVLEKLAECLRMTAVYKSMVEECDELLRRSSFMETLGLPVDLKSVSAGNYLVFEINRDCALVSVVVKENNLQAINGRWRVVVVSSSILKILEWSLSCFPAFTGFHKFSDDLSQVFSYPARTEE